MAREFPLISHRAAIYRGISGIMGGLLLFMGDMLLFYGPVATDKFDVMGSRLGESSSVFSLRCSQ